VTPDSIRHRLHSHAVGKRVVCVESCASTNDLAWKAALEGAPHGTAFFAEEQTEGRGRHGRSWLSPRGTGILCSILLRPAIEAERAGLVTVLGALAVADVAERFGVRARVRFPNDVYVDDGKLAGVLAESRFIGERPDLFILGIGLNVNGRPQGVGATCLAEERGGKVDRVQVARALLEAVDEWTERLDGPLDPFRRAWRERSDLPGRRVKITENGKPYSGTVTDVDCVEGIELRLSNGHARAFRAEHVEKLEMMA
jgi:BirA family biotin operon repressor/biotin-[acetyl-CoA-carboxylase] ligase